MIPIATRAGTAAREMKKEAHEMSTSSTAGVTTFLMYHSWCRLKVKVTSRYCEVVYSTWRGERITAQLASGAEGGKRGGRGAALRVLPNRAGGLGHARGGGDAGTLPLGGAHVREGLLGLQQGWGEGWGAVEHEGGETGARGAGGGGGAEAGDGGEGGISPPARERRPR